MPLVTVSSPYSERRTINVSRNVSLHVADTPYRRAVMRMYDIGCGIETD